MMSRFQKLFNVVAVGFGLSFCPAVAACDLKVRLPNFEPLAMKDNKGHWTGIDVDHAKALLDQADCTYTFTEMPFARGLHRLQSGELDMMLELSKTPEREATLHFIGPQRHEATHLVIKKGLVESITSWQQVETLDVALLRQRGTFVGERFEQVLKANSILNQRMVLMGATGVRIDMIKKGRADGFFAERAYLQYRLKNNPDYSMVEIHPLVIYSASVYFAFSKASVDQALINRLTKAYQQLVKSNKLQQIEALYVGKTLPQVK